MATLHSQVWHRVECSWEEMSILYWEIIGNPVRIQDLIVLEM